CSARALPGGGAGGVPQDAGGRAGAGHRRVVRAQAGRLLRGPGAPSLMLALLLAAAVSVTAEPSQSQLGVGEPFAVWLKANGPSGASYTFPGELVSDNLELRSVAPDAGASPEPPGLHCYQAAAYALGSVELPSLTVRYRLADGTSGEASTQPVTLQV